MNQYSKWEEVPDTLATKTKLNEMGLKPAKDQRPVAIKRGWKSYPDYDLYEIAVAVPKRKLSEAQAQALEAARKKAMTTTCCGRLTNTINWREYGDMCWRCWEAEQERRHQEFLKEAEQEAAEWARGVLADERAVILDTETTGLQGRIVDIAIIGIDGTVLLDTLVNPECPIPVGASNIHGITSEAVKDAPTFREVFEQIKAITEGASRVVIYNADFDTSILNWDCYRSEVSLDFRSECAMQAYARWYGEWNDYHKSFRWQKLNGGHRALGDCLATLERLREMAGAKEEAPAGAGVISCGDRALLCLRCVLCNP